MDDILVEKERRVQQLSDARRACEKKWDEWGQTSDPKIPIMAMLIVGGIAAYGASSASGWRWLATFFAIWFAIFLPIGYSLSKYAAYRRKIELRELDRKLEDARVDLARVKRKVAG